MITCPCQHRKEEATCRAYLGNSGNAEKQLECNDECAQVKRNQQLAEALGVIPIRPTYSGMTLSMYRKNATWSQTQEGLLRIFAQSEDKRLTFEPMLAAQRAFLHSLANDFGLDSTSLNAEPQRYVTIFKGPKFVAAPAKSLADDVPNSVMPEAVVQIQTPRTAPSKWNALLLKNLRFGITSEEIHVVLTEDATFQDRFDLQFISSDEALLAVPEDSKLRSVKMRLAAILDQRKIATAVELCLVEEGRITKRETGQGEQSVDGWSRVAAKGAAPRATLSATPFGQKSAYTVLGRKTKEVKQTPLVENWSDALDLEDGQVRHD